MKYENTKSKLKKIWTQSNINKYEITSQQETSKRIKESNKNTHILPIKSIIDLSTGWKVMIAPSLDYTTDTWNNRYRIQWDIELQEMPIKLIPFIRYQVVYKINGESEFKENDLVVRDPQVPVLFRLEDLKDSNGVAIEDFKKVTMLVGYTLKPYSYSDLDKTYDIQAKLLIKLYNPELLI